jgi:rare lipoprotein A
MQMRRTIGISVAFLLISAGTMAKTPEKSTGYHPGQPHDVKPEKAEHRTGNRQPVSSGSAQKRSLVRYATHHAAPPRYRHAFSAHIADDNSGPPDSYQAAARGFGGREIGTAAWYNLIGRYTSTGERLDGITATAAHRTLPLSSYAKVTNLDSGRSVIVKINDRGPRTRRFIIDLSPRAAEELDMKRAGVASVAVEPVSVDAAGATPTVAAFRSPGAPVTQ